MNSFQRAWRSMFRKPVKSSLLLLVIVAVSLSLLCGMACQNASVQTQDTTRQAVGAGLRLDANEANRSKRLDECVKQIGDSMEGSYGGVHMEILENGFGTQLLVYTDNSFESLDTADIEQLAGQRLLHRLVAHAAMITLALDGIGGCPLAGRDVDAIVAAGNGDIDAAEAVPFQHLGAEIFKIMAVHFVNILKADDSFHGQASLFSPTGIKQSRLPEQTALGNPITKRGISRFFPKSTHWQ